MRSSQPALSHLRLRMDHGPDDAFDGAKQNLPFTKHLNALPSSERFPCSPALFAFNAVMKDFGATTSVEMRLS